MKQSQLIKIVDVFSFIALLLIVSTGTLLEFTLPIRSGPATVLGMTRHEWGALHLYVSIGFLVMMSLHLFTHIKYIKQLLLGNASTASKYRMGVGLIGLVALLLIILAPFLAPVNEGEGSGRRHGAGYRLNSGN
ncbi:DUF4405 domain-containing protein [Methylomarinum vadi]|uniref:DUF4405 domain-containing protein n=1 Tax=Methylomarinum vadi TaxID=438855 RepID=UPI0004DF8466|nr:DUF4405 domain-containing protein [Methylomarinum vadi]